MRGEMRALNHNAVRFVGQTSQEAVLQDGNQRGRAAHEQIHVLAALVPVEHHVVGTLEKRVAHIVFAHALVTEALCHQLESRTIPHFGILDRAVKAVIGVIQGEGFGVFQNETLELAGEQIGLKAHRIPGVKRPGFAVFHRDEVVIDHKTEQAVRPAERHIGGPGREVGMLEVFRLNHDFHAHVFFRKREKILFLDIIAIFIALRRKRTDQFFAQHLVAGKIRHAHKKTVRTAEGIDTLGAVPAEVFLAHIQHPGTAQRKGCLIDHRIFKSIKNRLIEIVVLHRKLAGPIPVIGIKIIFDELGVEAVLELQIANILHGRKFGGYGEFQRPVPGRRDQRQLDIGLVIMVGGIIEPQAVSRLVHQNFFAFCDLHVAHHVLVGFQIDKIGVFTEYKKRIAHERRGVFLCFGNVKQAAGGHMSLAAFNLALAHDHAFRQMAYLAVLVLESPGPQPAQIRDIGHVGGGLQPVRRLGSGGRRPGEAGRAHHRPDQQVFPSSLEKHRGFLEAKGWCSRV